MFIGKSCSELGPAPRAVHDGTVGRRLYRKVLAVGAAEITKKVEAVPAGVGGRGFGGRSIGVRR